MHLLMQALIRTTSRMNKNNREDFIGSYSVERMTVHLGAATVMFDPIATLIIGGFGRVDVTSLTNRVRLIAIDASEGGGRRYSSFVSKVAMDRN